MANNFQQQPWSMSGEKRLEDILADQIMGANGDKTMSLLSKFAFEEMSFNRFEHELRRDAQDEHMEKIAKLREERERLNREEADAKAMEIDQKK